MSTFLKIVPVPDSAAGFDATGLEGILNDAAQEKECAVQVVPAHNDRPALVILSADEPFLVIAPGGPDGTETAAAKSTKKK